MTKVEFLEIWTGSGLFDIGVGMRFRELEQLHYVIWDLSAKFDVITG